MPKLYLIPNTINEDAGAVTIPPYIREIVHPLRIFFTEDEKSARRLLKKADPEFPLHAAKLYELNEHTKAADVREYVKMIQQADAGIISESGCPCVADPGADLVFLAHQHHIEVLPLIGPSSILMALMASGLNGQNFAFNGYLPKDKQERVQKLKSLEKRSKLEGQTQIFMDTPYRNQALLDDVIASLDSKTLLCIAQDITGPAQFIKTVTVGDWKRKAISLEKKPALFLI